jgi:hypothetical protein
MGVLVCGAFVASESVFTRCVTNIKNKNFYYVTYLLPNKMLTPCYEVYIEVH